MYPQAEHEFSSGVLDEDSFLGPNGLLPADGAPQPRIRSRAWFVF